jgi:cob(I)alamin adenosyltransferase
MIMRKGLLQVYTGNGKGKTTAALGQALRALGHNWQVTVIQFMKGFAKCGEIQALGQFPTCRVLQCGREGRVDMSNPNPEDIALAKQGLEKVRLVIDEDKCDLLILDEINVALACKLLQEQEVREILCTRPAKMEVVCTGRYAPSWLVELADLVTEMRSVKHPFEKGIAAREGIEF